jgi:hypothetical protein
VRVSMRGFGLIQPLCGRSTGRGRKPLSGRLIAVVKLKPIGESLFVFRDAAIILSGVRRACESVAVWIHSLIEINPKNSGK